MHLGVAVALVYPNLVDLLHAFTNVGGCVFERPINQEKILRHDEWHELLCEEAVYQHQ